ncbi:hypothetical protein LOZ12_002413 [Ophidiomyces ophidiicola]|uniref:Uncharacterized protein n=1 Tax=Ophidiomyces ophidiicola TaxID=1387563 RepID=A0ACB8UY86_9EURO|nr:uncharacterized protein LOZ57_004964 [Ophidiomyces ophidiicola]KAI1909086.1 hypothetical protein LOZ61_005228 [Ophidiomyces ophidiicola]KAI1918688.1 hypothetical protein LOZ64_002662 [Ophidiomyces ophidiicola]KAI1922966.1 hypothetical protein LOZ60_005451 [Ophidiomyces ophidiicola]KAI1944287.1 hypothetical protein LOZ57_004964 [Ophidiomyces ophidiicola]KAI1949515.1 hypothetical protein LOZ62_002266 [Ophidiomyces ophidiicola]
MGSNIHRLLPRRDKFLGKDLSGWILKDTSNESTSDSVWKLFSAEQYEPDSNASQTKVLKQSISKLEQRISACRVANIGKPQIRYALQSYYSGGDVEKAFELLMIIEDSIGGILRTYRPSTKLLGAENRKGVTCYLDALLFAMFARLDFFEGVLYNTFDDEPRRNLVIFLRFWVNMLRSGKLITTDITKQLQGILAACGWAGAAQLKQQDVSEAFSFITEKLELPLITLKMDIFHTGKEEAGDDHKFVNERLLEVAIPPCLDDRPITLEECLEAYFNNRVEVKRFLNRQNTLRSISSMDSLSKCGADHIEIAEPDSCPASPSHFSQFPTLSEERPLSPETPTTPRKQPRARRTASIFRERFIPDSVTVNNKAEGHGAGPANRYRKGSIRKEVLMPAWQIFSLIPWYTDGLPTNDAETASHFSTKRPILGICLKRYSVLPNGTTVRLDTYIDIPTEIGLPHFIKDDNLEEDAPLYGNFKLSLQAVICHQGNSVDSGHYISLVRGSSLVDSNTSSNDSSLSDDSFPDNINNYWLRFDDIAQERITVVDIEKALKDESPYLLFYQILPINADPADLVPPPYEESNGYGGVLLEKGIYENSEATSATELQEQVSAKSSVEYSKKLLEPPIETDMNGTPDKSRSSRNKSRSRSRPASSDNKFFSYLSRRKSTEPLSRRSIEHMNNVEKRHSADIPVENERVSRSITLKRATRPDRECVVM